MSIIIVKEVKTEGLITHAKASAVVAQKTKTASVPVSVRGQTPTLKDADAAARKLVKASKGALSEGEWLTSRLRDVTYYIALADSPSVALAEFEIHGGL